MEYLELVNENTMIVFTDYLLMRQLRKAQGKKYLFCNQNNQIRKKGKNR